MPNMGDKVCLNHTSVPAVSRCETCFKPLCEECILEIEGRHFCSEKCAENSFDKRGRMAVLDAANQKSKAAAMVRNIVILLVLAGIAYAGYVYWQGHKKEVQNLGAQVRQQAVKTAATVEKKAEAIKTAVATNHQQSAKP
jgi:hypothetical protein